MTIPLPARPAPSPQARHAGAAELAGLLQAARQDTLATFAAYERALPSLQVPFDACLNPPLWELGHVGWFQEYWIARNPGRRAGHRADPDLARTPSVREGADALYDSALVPHRDRWSLPLPDAACTRADLARQLASTLELLAQASDDDDALYFFRLALFHEDMHHEAALYMAQALGIPIEDPRWQPAPRRPRHAAAALRLPAGPRTFGWQGDGFAFDNELPPRVAQVEAFEIDAAVVCWDEYLRFVQEGGYAERSFWSDAGWLWASTREGAPRFLARRDGQWHVERFGAWRALDPREPACHLSHHEAEAWCRWAGRRLPTELEWETAAREAGEQFESGAVWEWTASAFAPHAGFEPHPYRAYSAPWFDGRPALRGASFATQPRMREIGYRNFFPADRTDIFAGFRSCAAR